MANDSSTGGYIQPVDASAPLADEALEDVIHDLIAGITGLANTLIVPRWQTRPPKQPDISTDWCAFGITEQSSDANAAVVHEGAGDGTSQYIRHVDLDVLASFYGPNASANAMALRDGLQIAQNIEAIKTKDMAFVGTDNILAAPDLLNNQWVRRFDLPIFLRRKVTRTYPIKNILSAPVTVVRG